MQWQIVDQIGVFGNWLFFCKLSLRIRFFKFIRSVFDTTHGGYAIILSDYLKWISIFYLPFSSIQSLGTDSLIINSIKIYKTFIPFYLENISELLLREITKSWFNIIFYIVHDLSRLSHPIIRDNSSRFHNLFLDLTRDESLRKLNQYQSRRAPRVRPCAIISSK